MTQDDFIYAPTEIGWFSSEKGRKLMKKAEEEGLIEIEGDDIQVTFDYKNIDIPLGFEPNEDIFEEKVEKKSVFTQMLDEVVGKSGEKRQRVMSMVNEKQDALNIDIEVALLLVTDELGVKLKDKKGYIEEIEEKVRGSD